MPIEGIVLPTYFQMIDAPEKLGITVVALGLGGVAGTLAFVAFGSRFRRRPMYVGSLLISTAAVLGMALLPPFPILVALCVIAGFAYGPIGPLVNTEMQERAPDNMRGRVVGLIVGPLIQNLGVDSAFLLMACAVFAVAVSSIFVKSLKQMDEPQVGT